MFSELRLYESSTKIEPEVMQFSVNDSTSIGRDGNLSSIFLFMPYFPTYISRVHAIVRYSRTKKQWKIVNNNSKNGLFVNGNRIETKNPINLHDSDIVCFGNPKHAVSVSYRFNIIEACKKRKRDVCENSSQKRRKIVTPCTRNNHAIFDSTDILNTIVSLLKPVELIKIRRTSKLFLQSCEFQLNQLKVLTYTRDMKHHYIQHFMNICPSITSLDVSGCFQMDVSSMHHIIQRTRDVDKLETIDITGCNFLDDKILSDVGKCTNLKTFIAKGCHRLVQKGGSDKFQKFMSDCSKLNHIDLFACGKYDQSILLSIFRNQNALTSINIGGISPPCISDLVMITIGQYVRKLECLYMMNCKYVTDDGISAVVRACHLTLRELDIQYCRKLTDDTLYELNCTQLKYLSIRKCIRLSEDAIIHYIKHSGKNLEYLDLSFLPITDLTIQAISDNCSSTIHTLSIQNCSNITEESIRSLITNCKQLKLVDIKNCSQVSSLLSESSQVYM